MKYAMTWLMGRLPIGWLQLRHNPTRLTAAVGGVTFANVLIFMQLGFMNALFDTSVQTHRNLIADVFVASADFRSLREANPLPRSRMFQALGVPGVVDATPLYLATMNWTDPVSGDTTNFRVIGVDPDRDVFVSDAWTQQVRQLRVPDTGLLDRRMRDFPEAIQRTIEAEGEFHLETLGRRLVVQGLIDQGASFDVDGTFVVSDETFMRLFPKREPGTPTLILVRCEPDANPDRIAAAMNDRFPEQDARAFSRARFIAAEQAYQAKQTPIGFVFGFGVVMGIIVGLVIVYQVLSTDVQDHLAEYATFKAIGYAPGYFRSIVFEEALCLSALGFVPGLLIALVLYLVAANATALPISMPWTRPVFVFLLTAAMCTVSGVIATQRLNAADPAELF